MQTHAIRLMPGEDLRQALTHFTATHQIKAGFIITCVGSLSRVRLRMAGAQTTITRDADFEIIALVGTLSPDGPHLHISVSDATGQMTGGHLMEGAIVRTTAEVIIGTADAYSFTRELDAATGYQELVITYPTRD